MECLENVKRGHRRCKEQELKMERDFVFFDWLSTSAHNPFTSYELSFFKMAFKYHNIVYLTI